jgi:hypothetical protein
MRGDWPEKPRLVIAEWRVVAEGIAAVFELD